MQSQLIFMSIQRIIQIQSFSCRRTAIFTNSHIILIFTYIIQILMIRTLLSKLQRTIHCNLLLYYLIRINKIVFGLWTLSFSIYIINNRVKYILDTLSTFSRYLYKCHLIFFSPLLSNLNTNFFFMPLGQVYFPSTQLLIYLALCY